MPRRWAAAAVLALLAAVLVSCGSSGNTQPSLPGVSNSHADAATGDVLASYSIRGGIAGYDRHLTVYKTGRVVYRDDGNRAVRFKITRSTVSTLRGQLEHAKSSSRASSASPPASDQIDVELLYMGHNLAADNSSVIAAVPMLHRLLVRAISKAIGK